MLIVIFPLLAKGRDRLETTAAHLFQRLGCYPLLARGRDRLETVYYRSEMCKALDISYSLEDAIDWK